MITVNVIELFVKSAELLADGFLQVELSEIDADDEYPASLSFDAVDGSPCDHVDYESIDDCSKSESFELSFKSDSIAPYPITFNDLRLMSHAFHNAIENCITSLEDVTISTDLRGEITSSMKYFESYVKKLDSFLSDHTK